jgi:hypothetical protein
MGSDIAQLWMIMMSKLINKKITLVSDLFFIIRIHSFPHEGQKIVIRCNDVFRYLSAIYTSMDEHVPLFCIVINIGRLHKSSAIRRSISGELVIDMERAQA